MNRTNLISHCIIFFITGVFVGFILTMVYVKDTFREEITVNVTPVGLMRDPYRVGYIIKGQIDRQTFKIVLKNGVQVSDEWLGYSY